MTGLPMRRRRAWLRPLQKPAPAATLQPSPVPRLGPLAGAHGHARPRHGPAIEVWGVSVTLPRTSILVRALAAAIALLVFVQAVSCGMFFCVAVPFSHRASYVDVRDIVSDVPSLARPPPGGGAAAALAAAAAAAAAPGAAGARQPALLPHHGPAAAVLSTPKLIPRVIHQTYRTKRFPRGARPLVRSWRAVNGDAWEVRFYDDVAAVSFVRREFPEYLEAYLALPKDVERADFFKYMVVLRMGGAYADIDAECRRPLDGVISPVDTLVAGWDAEVADAAAAARRGMARRRQLLPWFFAAAPGHPALRELCDHVARNAHNTFSNSSVRDTQERTGQGVWTDVVLRHATNGMAAKASDPWNVRILPRVAFGVHPSGVDGLTPDLRDAVVLHHFTGTWQARAAPRRSALQVLAPLLPSAWLGGGGGGADGGGGGPPPPGDTPGVSLFPVSASFEPPFTVMTRLAGAGDAAAGGGDAGAEVTRFGGYQPALLPSRRPSVAEALVGSLGPGAAREGTRHMPLGAPGGGDGARRGVFVDVGAGEGFFSLAAAARGHRVLAFEAAPASLEAFRASIAYNGFEGLIEVVDNVTLGAAREELCLPDGGAAGGEANGDAAAAAQREEEEEAAAAAAGEEQQRLLLGARADVETLRVAAHGHEGWVLTGLMPYLRRVHRPRVVYFEFRPAAMRAAGYADPAGLIWKLRELGYADAAHAGRVCDARWSNVTNALRSQGSFTPTAQLAYHQPTWCKLRPENFEFVAREAGADGEPENLLFVLSGAEQDGAPPGEGGGGTAAAEEGQEEAAGPGARAAAARARRQGQAGGGEGGAAAAAPGAAGAAPAAGGRLAAAGGDGGAGSSDEASGGASNASSRGGGGSSSSVSDVSSSSSSSTSGGGDGVGGSGGASGAVPAGSAAS
ncbi:MAG: hypothetical protein J3K34DRAFT_385638 [Monoraphidium minutum]|nr:MAG: hypothetical protein J3K34DRAFT_385638 [Monoraphidium minutum]